MCVFLNHDWTPLPPGLPVQGTSMYAQEALTCAVIHPEFPAPLASLTKFPGISEPLMFPGVSVIIRHHALGSPVHRTIFGCRISRLLIFTQHHPLQFIYSFPET